MYTATLTISPLARTTGQEELDAQVHDARTALLGATALLDAAEQRRDYLYSLPTPAGQSDARDADLTAADIAVELARAVHRSAVRVLDAATDAATGGIL